jgi:hypothetical protein|tara:strand:- start:11890 stop:12276 length:387 start_codon:yes stop_codon:yes gene_type:complete
MKVEIKITGEGEGAIESMVENILERAVESGLSAVRADYRYGKVESCPPIFYTGGPNSSPSEQDLTSPSAISTPVEDAVEMSVSFASIISARLADKHDLNVTDFEDHQSSGKRGFTVGDVIAIVAQRDS